MKKLIWLAAAVLMCSLFIKCDGSAMSLKARKKVIYTTTNQKKLLRIKGYRKLPVWTSKNASIVSTPARGYIQTVNPGKTTVKTRIKVKVKKHGKNKYRKRSYKVTFVVMGISKTAASIKLGSSEQIRVYSGGSKVKWKSSNKKVAKVSKGKIKAVSSGKATITAVTHGHRFKCAVRVPTVSCSKEKLVASPPGGKGLQASKSQAKITVKNSFGTPLYSMKNSSIASIDQSGTITALKAGTAVAYVYVDSMKYEVSVRVSDRPVDIYLNYCEKYSKYVKNNGEYFARGDTAESTFAAAKTKVENKKKVKVNCSAHVKWAFNDMGISPNSIYGLNGSFKNYSGDVATNLKKITEGSAIGMNYKEAIDKGLLKAGDICAFKGATHTFTYTGKGYNFYDGGSNVQRVGYKNIGLTMDYTYHGWYEKKYINKILRWRY